MEAIEQFQRNLGAPVIGFLAQNWIFLLIAGALFVGWFVAGDVMFTSRRPRTGFAFGDADLEDEDSSSDSGDSGGGGDGD